MSFTPKGRRGGQDAFPGRRCDLRVPRWWNLADMGEAIYIIS